MKKILKAIIVFIFISIVVLMFNGTNVSAKVSEKSYTVGVGEKVKLKTNIKTPAKGYVWKSSNNKTARISSYGNVLGVKAGKTTITLLYNKKVCAKFNIIVKKAPTSVYWSKKSVSLYSGMYEKLNVKVNSSSVCNKYTFSSSNNNVVKVSKYGNIRAISKGQAKIYVKTYNGKKAVCRINVKSASKIVALTFDDGPVYSNTSRLLDSLKKYNYHATFFMVGYEIAGNESLLKREVKENHELAIHTWNHPYLTKISNAQIKKQITDTQNAVKNATGLKPVLVRPPYGAYNDNVLSVFKRLGCSAILWNTDTRDWASTNVTQIKNEILKQARDGAVLVLHDLRKTTVDAVIEAIPILKANGYDLVTVSELAKIKGIKLEPGKVFHGAF